MNIRFFKQREFKVENDKGNNKKNDKNSKKIHINYINYDENYLKTKYPEDLSPSLDDSLDQKLEKAIKNTEKCLDIFSYAAISEFIITPELRENGLYVYTSFDISCKRYIEELKIEPVEKLIRFGSEGLILQDNNKICSLDNIADFIRDLFLYIDYVEKEKIAYSEDKKTHINATCSVRGLSIFSGFYLINNKKSRYFKMPDLYHTHDEEFFLKIAALEGNVKDVIKNMLEY